MRSRPRESAWLSLLLFNLRAGALQRIKVAGQIMGAGEGQYFMVDDTNGLRFTAAQTNELAAGDLVEVVGFPEVVGPSPMLREAVVRRTGRAELPEARRLRPQTC